MHGVTKNSADRAPLRLHDMLISESYQPTRTVHVAVAFVAHGLSHDQAAPLWGEELIQQSKYWS